MSRHIILLKGGLPTLDLFVDEMARGRNDVTVLNLREAQEAILYLHQVEAELNEESIVITFNSVGVNLKLGGSEIWKRKNVKLVNVLVDHPIYHIQDVIKDFYQGYYVATVDLGHARFLQKVIPTFSTHFFFLPHGGACTERIVSNDERDIDLLYIGSVFDPDKIVFQNIDFLDAESFYQHLIDVYENIPSYEIQEAVNEYLVSHGIKVSGKQWIELISYGISSVEKSFITKRRIELIEAFAKAGHHVTICGCAIWKSLADAYPEQITYLGMKSPQECLELISQTKILINDHPYFMHGAHERVFNGMLNGTVVLSNYSFYLKERFENTKSYLCWDGMDTKEAVELVTAILENDGERERIAMRAYDEVAHDTWGDRLQELLGHMESLK